MIEPANRNSEPRAKHSKCAGRRKPRRPLDLGRLTIGQQSNNGFKSNAEELKEEIARLRCENEYLRMQWEIVKTTVAILSEAATHILDGSNRIHAALKKYEAENTRRG